MNNGILVQNLLDKTSSDVGLIRSSIVGQQTIPTIYGYGGDEYWKYDPTKLVFLIDTRYSTNTTITLQTGSGTAYDHIIDWGDGNKFRYVGTTSSISYTYSNHGIYLIQIGGSATTWGANFVNSTANKIIKILSFGNFPFNALYYGFYGCSNLIEVPKTIPSGITQAQNLFQGASKFNGDVSKFDTSNITSFSNMFNGASNFNQNINSWNTSSLTNLQQTFYGAINFNQPLNSWNTANVTNMFNTFNFATNFNQPLNNWNVRKVTNFSNMFTNTNFNSSLSGWAPGADVIGTVDLLRMFQTTPFNQDLSSWNTSNVTSMVGMFNNATAFNQDLSSWDTSKVTNMGQMFWNTIFNNGGSSGINNWNTSNVTSMATMFQSSSFNQPIGSWNVSKVTTMLNMFLAANQFNQPLNNWNLAGLNVNTALDGFMSGKTGASAYSTANYDALLIGWNNNKLASANGVANWRTDLRPNFGGAKYTSGGAAATARADLVSYGWTITDGGPV